MDITDRRRVLRAVGLGLGGSLAGCLSGDPGGTATGTERPSATDSATQSPTETPPSDADVTFEVLQLGTGLERPAWRADGEGGGHAELYASAAAARGRLGLEALAPDRREAAESFVGSTDFGAERLLFVASVGPDTCYSRVEVASLRVVDATLAGGARAVDTSEAGEGCGDAITYPAALVRVRFEGDPRDQARIRITDGWDEQREVVAAAIERDPGALSGHVRPADDPATVPAALDCGESGFRRHDEGFSAEPPWGLTADGWGAFALRVDALEVARRETVTVSMTNVGAGEGATGNRHKYNLQVRTEAGWEDVRGTTDGDPVAYTDEAIIHEPGEGFEWSLEMTPEGVIDGHPRQDRLSVCPGLPAGRYRFAFWEPSVAVAFDLVD